MCETKILKARCKKTGLYYGLELRQYSGSWEVVNMVRLTDEEGSIVCSEVKQPGLKTHSNLVSCSSCGTRLVGGCTCSHSLLKCNRNMGYNFECIYCKSFEIDYSRGKGKTPYTEWAGISNIPTAIKDSYGNPMGSQYDLAQDGSFKGYTIVVLNFCNEVDFKEPAKALEKKGFKIIEYKYDIDLENIKNILDDDRSQLWVISDKHHALSGKNIEFISDYFKSGHGVYIWGDNDPYFVDANKILKKLFNASMSGDYIGSKVLGVQKGQGKPGIIENHVITTGITNFFEGITIANITSSGILTPLIYSSDCKVVASYYDLNGQRAIADGGFTRLYCNWDSAGTDRYIVNAAAWLANIERFGYIQ